MAEERTPEQLEQDAIEDKIAGQTVAVEVVNNLVDTCGEKLYEHYLKSREVPYSSRKVIKDVLEVVNWMYRGKDTGEINILQDEVPAITKTIVDNVNDNNNNSNNNDNNSNNNNDSSNNNNSSSKERWTAEQETMPAPIDSWASGAMNIRKKPVKYNPLPIAESSKAPSDAGTARTRGSRRGVSTRQSARSKLGGGRSKKKGMTLESRIRELDAPEEKSKDDKRNEKRRLPPEERARLRAIRDMERAEAEIQKRLEEAKLREQEEKEKHEQLMKELKGKDFVFDRNGNVIVIQQMKPEKMPPYAYSMDVTIQGGNDEILAPVSTVSPTKKQSKKKKKKRQSSENAEGGDEFFKESTSQQPSLLQIMDVQAGVALKEGDGGKQGPQLLEDPKKMSRATYKMHQTMVSQPAGDQEQTTVGADNDVDKVQTNVGETMDASNVDMLALLAEDDGIGPPSPIAQAARLPETSMQDEDDENVKLIKAADWGSNVKGKDPTPAPLPHKPTSRERRETLGQMSSRAPRDRPFITKEPLKRLPPPQFPKTQGHGSYATLPLGNNLTTQGSTQLTENSLGDNLNTDGSALSPKGGLGRAKSTYVRDWAKDEPGSIKVSPSANHYVKQLTQ